MKDIWADLQAGGDDDNVDETEKVIDDDDDDDAMVLGWSLEQLEKELAYLESQDELENEKHDGQPTSSSSLLSSRMSPPIVPQPSTTAASLVVSHAQEQQRSNQVEAGVSTTTTTTTTAMDAWSQSLQNFTALSLEQDFLMADESAKQRRKQQQQQGQTQTTTATATATPGIDAELLRNVQEYNVVEVATIPPPTTSRRPPGMPSPSPQKNKGRMTHLDTTDVLNPPPLFGPSGLSPSDEDKNQQDGTPSGGGGDVVVIPPDIKPLPPTPQNSEASLPYRVPPTPQNSSASLHYHPSSSSSSVPPTPPTSRQASLSIVPGGGDCSPPIVATTTSVPLQTTMTQQQSPAVVMTTTMPTMKTTTMMTAPLPSSATVMTTTTTTAAVAATTTAVATPVGTADVKRASAWQTPSSSSLSHPSATATTPMPVGPPPIGPIYCQPDPSVPPIPSGALRSSFMSARDLSYVLHSMMKPILVLGVSPDDYDVLYWQKRRCGSSGGAAAGNRRRMVQTYPNVNTTTGGTTSSSSTTKLLQEEMMSRAQRTREWTVEQKTLGHTAKSDVSRPRALIAVQSGHDDDDDDAAATSSMPNRERASLWKARLYVDRGYQAYYAVMDVWRATPPGTSVAPNEIQPHLMKLLKCLGVKLNQTHYTVDKTVVSLIVKLPKGQTLLARIFERAVLPPKAVEAILPLVLTYAVHFPSCDDVSNVRLFRACSTVITTLPHMDPACILHSVKAVSHPDALKSTARMECVHALLQRGTALSTQDASFAQEWTKTEQQFMELLG